MFVKLTEKNYGFIHFDLMGFIRFGTKNSERLASINQLFIDVKNKGGNLFVPSFSYSYTEKQDYSIRNSPCTIGPVFDYLRSQNPGIRTIDALFSYLAFSNEIGRSNFIPQDYESFGDNSIIAKAFREDGVIMTVGDRMSSSTELHYIERLLEVPYRINKVFSGSLIDLDEQKHHQNITYFCRDLDFAKKHSLVPGFERVVEDLKTLRIVQRFDLDGQFVLEVAKMSDVYELVKEKIKTNPFYLLKKI